MSERTHSNVSAAPPRRRPTIAVGAGTLTLLAVAGIWFQFSQAPEGKAQTEAPQSATGKATLGTATSNRIMAKVNNDAITYEAVAKACVERYGVEVLDNLINRLIIQQECDRRGITVTQAEVQQEVVNTAKKFNLPLDTWYQMLKTERGLTPQQYHNDVIWPMLALKKLAGTDVQVTEADMQKGFERDYGPRMKGRLILVEGNSRQAAQIWEKCRANPDDFDRLAREYSADPNTRPLGGVIPPVRRHGGNPQVEEEAFKLQPGEISALIEIKENQYVILKCEGFTDPVVDDIRVVWNDLYAQLVEEKVQTSVAKVFEEIKDRAVVHNFLTRTSTGSPVAPVSGIQTPASGVVPAASSAR